MSDKHLLEKCLQKGTTNYDKMSGPGEVKSSESKAGVASAFAEFNFVNEKAEQLKRIYTKLKGCIAQKDLGKSLDRKIMCQTLNEGAPKYKKQT